MSGAPLQVRRADERGHARHGWLESRHTFSFAGYHDPRYMGYRSLRVLNDDRVAPGAGFGRHGHRDMEILTYVVEGVLEHRDDLGHVSRMGPGDVQRLRAGTGIVHSEMNASGEVPVRFLQIWILPDEEGLSPGYEQRHFPAAARNGRLCCLASPDGREGSLGVAQDALLYAALLDPGASVTHPLAEGRHAWIQLVRGRVRVGAGILREGDGAAIAGRGAPLAIEAQESAELLVFDLA